MPKSTPKKKRKPESKQQRFERVVITREIIDGNPILMTSSQDDEFGGHDVVRSYDPSLEWQWRVLLDLGFDDAAYQMMARRGKDDEDDNE